MTYPAFQQLNLKRTWFTKSLTCLALALICSSAISCKSEDAGNQNLTEQCGDGIDNDNDGFIDCDDNDCDGSNNCSEVCNDGVDNDNDGFIDCDDGDCEDFADCLIERCIDGVDNDGDGLVDCDDPDCATNPSCE